MRVVVMVTDRASGDGFVLASDSVDFDNMVKFGGLVYGGTKAMGADKADDVRTTMLLLQMKDEHFVELVHLIHKDPDRLVPFNQERSKEDENYVMGTVNSSVDSLGYFEVVQRLLQATNTPFNLMESAP